METLADCVGPIGYGLDKSLRDIAGMDVVDGLSSEVRQGNFAARRQIVKNLKIEIRGRIQWNPSFAYDVSRMQYRRGEMVPARFSQEISFDCGFANSVITEGAARLLFRNGDFDARPVYPDGSAVQEVLNFSAQSFDELRGAFQCVRSQIDHGVGL